MSRAEACVASSKAVIHLLMAWMDQASGMSSSLRAALGVSAGREQAEADERAVRVRPCEANLVRCSSSLLAWSAHKTEPCAHSERNLSLTREARDSKTIFPHLCPHDFLLQPRVRGQQGGW